MIFLETFKIAMAGISGNKFRSFLTVLGIIIGVAAVIILVSLGTATQSTVSQQFSHLNARQIHFLGNNELPFQQQLQLTEEIGELVQEMTVGIEDVIPYKNFYQEIKYRNVNKMYTVRAVMPRAKEKAGLFVKYGRFITTEDIKFKKKVVVIGEKVLQELIQLDDYSQMLGKEMQIDNEDYYIVGILGDAGLSNIAIPDESVIIPFSTQPNQYLNWGQEVSYFMIVYDQLSSPEDIISQVSEILNKRYGKTPDGQERFTLYSVEENNDMTSNVIRAFTFVLGGIAAISLIVGGIGVMNIMLVTVKERTREIGVRLALGATQKNVQDQFLVESILISLSGGIIGTILGALISIVTNYILGELFPWWRGYIPFWIVYVSLAITIGVGVIFGFYPAYKASRMQPIDCLRNEK